ncbi:MAG TPA: enoyl-CoA hydratase-related protein, partial [Anaeromyxobacteraceae bacterium]|nr:enoyl-CoA hydratase-related protein [Anaeromyxobacteraceae bacterium]
MRTKVADRVAEIEIHRPDKKNALTGVMYDAMSEAILRAEADPGVRVVLLHGQPDCFTSGNDLADFVAAGQAGGAGTVPTPATRFLGV